MLRLITLIAVAMLLLAWLFQTTFKAQPVYPFNAYQIGNVCVFTAGDGRNAVSMQVVPLDLVGDECKVR